MAQDSQCWFPDGTTAAINDTPCNSSATISSCCSRDSLCLDNGICMQNSGLSRDSCTSKTWETPCFQHCLNSSWNDKGGQALTACASTGGIPGMIACGFNNPCDDDSEMFQVPGGTAVILREGEALGLGIAGPVLVPNTTLRAQEQATSSCTLKSNSESIAGDYTVTQMAALGADLGVSLSLALLAALATILVQRRQLKRLYIRRERAGGKDRADSVRQAQDTQLMYTYDKPTGPIRPPKHCGELEGTDASTMSSTNLNMASSAKSPVSP